MTHDDILRRAAALMRQRAEAATPGPWQALCDGYGDISGGTSEDERRDLLWVRAGETNRGDIVSTYGLPDGPRGENVTHIASWHPAVALAVAVLLEDLADYLDWLQEHHPDAGPQHAAPAIAAARAYLGTTP